MGGEGGEIKGVICGKKRKESTAKKEWRGRVEGSMKSISSILAKPIPDIILGIRVTCSLSTFLSALE